jgi:hypothetical protein
MPHQNPASSGVRPPQGGMQHQNPASSSVRPPQGGMQHQNPASSNVRPPQGGMQHQNPGYSQPHTAVNHVGGGSFRREPPVAVRHVSGGGARVDYYRPYRFHGLEFRAYAPARFFAPRFYGWADAPWGFRVHYRWGWFGAPWFAGYRAYFAPYAVYTSAPFWLTDYMLAASLQQAWREGVAGCNCQYGMADAVKQSVAVEVYRQIELEKAEAAGYQANTPTFLDGRSHVFVVSNGTTADAGGQACALTGGDVVQLDANSQVDGANATVQVLSSKGEDCSTGSYVGVTLAQLQDMQNAMRATIDQGLQTLEAQQGQNGLPMAPADGMAMAQVGQ